MQVVVIRVVEYAGRAAGAGAATVRPRYGVLVHVLVIRVSQGYAGRAAGAGAATGRPRYDVTHAVVICVAVQSL